MHILNSENDPKTILQELLRGLYAYQAFAQTKEYGELCEQTKHYINEIPQLTEIEKLSFFPPETYSRTTTLDPFFKLDLYSLCTEIAAEHPENAIMSFALNVLKKAPQERDFSPLLRNVTKKLETKTRRQKLLCAPLIATLQSRGAYPRREIASGLALVLDTSEWFGSDNNTAITHALMAFLTSQIVPIFTTGELLYKLFLENEFELLNPNQWIAFEIISTKSKPLSFFLLVPKSYQLIAELKNYIIPGKKPNADECTALERKLGFKIDHMIQRESSLLKKELIKKFENIVDPNLEDDKRIPTFSAEVMAILAQKQNNNKVPWLSKLFVTKYDHQKVQKANKEALKKNSAVPPLTIYISGHGGSASKDSSSGAILPGAISEITGQDLTLLQDFFNEAVPVSLELIAACHIGGTNIFKITEDTTALWGKNYNYTKAITNSQESTSRGAADITDFGFTYFFVNATNNPPATLTKTGRLLSTVFWGASQSAELETVYMVKLPGQPWQQALPRETAVTLGRILAQTRSSNDPLRFPSFFTRKSKKQPTQPEIFLWYADQINFPIVFENANLPVIGSLIPGDAVHECAEVQVPDGVTINALANAFLATPIKVIKVFIIHKIEIKNLDNFLTEKTKDLAEGWYFELCFINGESPKVIATIKDEDGNTIDAYETAYKVPFDWQPSQTDITALITTTRESLQWGLQQILPPATKIYEGVGTATQVKFDLPKRPKRRLGKKV